jgi:acyl-coenzyme A synthetase/AMP-(fatty) acid ligase
MEEEEEDDVSSNAFDDECRLADNGIVCTFDTLCAMRGEDTAFLIEGVEVNDNTCEVSYSEVQMYSQYLAASLKIRFGIHEGDVVLLYCDGNSAAEAVCCLACTRIGAVFVPLDKVWLSQDSRMRHIMQTALPSAAIVVAETDSDPKVITLNSFGVHKCAFISPDGSFVVSSEIAEEAEALSYAPDLPSRKPMYILYTSGSTGVPKGVVGTELGLVNRVQWQLDTFPWTPCDRVCRRTPLVFVDALAEIFSALLAGVTIWCPNAALLQEGLGAVFPVAVANGVTRLTLLPTQVAYLRIS